MRVLFVTVALLWAISTPIQADESAFQAGQNVIAGQIDAFRAGENDRAYSFAAPNIKAIFPTVDRFMGMVTQGYRAVQMPKYFEFGRSRELDGGRIAQEVHLVGPDGRNYTALYELTRMEDGSWKISAVSMVPSKARTI